MNRSEFKKAIEDSPDPTPGYLYNEMAKWTCTDHAAQAALLRALFDQLKHPPSGPSVFVLYKVLHIIRVLCECGHPDFQRAVMQKDKVEVLKSFIAFRGAYSPQFGDALNEKVRREAKAAMDSAFTPQTRDASRYAGMGSSPMSASPSTSTSVFSDILRGGSSNGGCGGANDGQCTGNIAEMPRTSKWAEHMSEIAARGGTSGGLGSSSSNQTLLSQLAATAKAGFELLKEHEQLGMLQDRKGAHKEAAVGGTWGDYAEADAGAFQPVQVPGVVTHLQQQRQPGEADMADVRLCHGEKPGFFHPSAEGPPQPPLSSSSSAPVSHFSFISSSGATGTSPTPLVPPPAVATTTTTTTTTTEEIDTQSRLFSQPGSTAPLVERTPVQQLVWDYASLRTAPQRVEQKAFLQACAGLARGAGSLTTQSLALGEALGTYLATSHPWQRRLNVLVCIEAVLKQGGSGAAADMCAQSVRDYMRAHPDDLRRNVRVVQTSLRERATKVLELLGLQVEVEEAVVPPAVVSGGSSAFRDGAKTQPQNSLENLFGAHTSSSPPSVFPPAARAPDTGCATSAGLDLTGMDIKVDGSSSTRRGGGADDLNNTTAARPRRAPVRRDEVGNLFGDARGPSVLQRTGSAPLDSLFSSQLPTAQPTRPVSSSQQQQAGAPSLQELFATQPPSQGPMISPQDVAGSARQQPVASVWNASGGDRGVSAGLSTDTAQSHSRFLMGMERTVVSEEQKTNRDFANVQQEMMTKFGTASLQ